MNPFAEYTNEELRTMYNDEYTPWTKKGILYPGKMRSLLESEERYEHPSSIIALEKDFLNELAARFAAQK